MVTFTNGTALTVGGQLMSIGSLQMMIIERWVVGDYLDGLDYVKAKFTVGKETRLLREDSPEYRKAHVLLGRRIVVTGKLFTNEQECITRIREILRERFVTTLRKLKDIAAEGRKWGFEPPHEPPQAPESLESPESGLDDSSDHLAASVDPRAF